MPVHLNCQIPSSVLTKTLSCPNCRSRSRHCIMIVWGCRMGCLHILCIVCLIIIVTSSLTFITTKWWSSKLIWSCCGIHIYASFSLLSRSHSSKCWSFWNIHQFLSMFSIADFGSFFMCLSIIRIKKSMRRLLNSRICSSRPSLCHQ